MPAFSVAQECRSCGFCQIRILCDDLHACPDDEGIKFFPGGGAYCGKRGKGENI